MRSHILVAKNIIPRNLAKGWSACRLIPWWNWCVTYKWANDELPHWPGPAETPMGSSFNTCRVKALVSFVTAPTFLQLQHELRSKLTLAPSTFNGSVTWRTGADANIIHWFFLIKRTLFAFSAYVMVTSWKTKKNLVKALQGWFKWEIIACLWVPELLCILMSALFILRANQ